MDVANTHFIIEIPAKYLMPELKVEEIIPRYLDAYRDVKHLDLRHLDYYRVLRCSAALVDRAEGQELWNAPSILEGLFELILDVTGIRVELPRD